MEYFIILRYYLENILTDILDNVDVNVTINDINFCHSIEKVGQKLEVIKLLFVSLTGKCGKNYCIKKTF